MKHQEVKTNSKDQVNSNFCNLCNHDNLFSFKDDVILLRGQWFDDKALYGSESQMYNFYFPSIQSN